jgi:RNA polymerase sigma factor (sigma-70 family)
MVGNRAMQNMLYAQFASTMMAVCLRYSKCRPDAEEILQEGFIKVFTCLEQFKFNGSLEGWIKRIMINCALQKMRSKNLLHRVVCIEEVEDHFIDEDSVIDCISQKELLMQVQKLPTMCRIVFNLFVFEGMKHNEIAKLLEISEGTSKSNLHDARILLRQWVIELTVVNINTGT